MTHKDLECTKSRHFTAMQVFARSGDKGYLRQIDSVAISAALNEIPVLLGYIEKLHALPVCGDCAKALKGDRKKWATTK